MRSNCLQPNLDACLCPEDNPALGGPFAVETQTVNIDLTTGLPNKFFQGLKFLSENVVLAQVLRHIMQWVPHWISPSSCLHSLGTEIVSNKHAAKVCIDFVCFFSKFHCRVLETSMAKCFLVRPRFKPHVSAQPSTASSLSQGLTLNCLVTAALGHIWPQICGPHFGPNMFHPYSHCNEWIYLDVNCIWLAGGEFAIFAGVSHGLTNSRNNTHMI